MPLSSFSFLLPFWRGKNRPEYYFSDRVLLNFMDDNDDDGSGPKKRQSKNVQERGNGSPCGVVSFSTVVCYVVLDCKGSFTLRDETM